MHSRCSGRSKNCKSRRDAYGIETNPAFLRDSNIVYLFNFVEMKMKKFILLFLSIVLFACSDEQAVSIPDTVLSQEKMAEVLVDIHLLEASMNVHANPMTIASTDMQVGADVFKKHAITKKQYDESFVYYSQNPKLLGEIYQLVLNSLSKMQAEIMGKPDSLTIPQK